MVEYYERCIPAGACKVFSVANGSLRSWSEAKILKKEGVLEGVSDLIILAPGARTVFAEVKTETDKIREIKRGYQSPAQKAFQAEVEQLGFRYVILRSLEAFADLLIELGIPTRARPFVAQTYQPVPRE